MTLKPAGLPSGAGIIERRIIELGEEADGADARQIGPFRPPAPIPEAGDHDGARLRHALSCRRGRMRPGQDHESQYGKGAGQPESGGSAK